MTVTLHLDEATRLVVQALRNAGCTEENAHPTATALVTAECDGQQGHGLIRVPSYCAQILSGKVNGAAKPSLKEISTSAIAINADQGFAYPAIDLAIETLTLRAKEQTISIATIAHSHHFGQAGAHVERLAEAGLIGLAFSNSPKAIAFWGGTAPAMGTNPIAFASPLPNNPPLVIDLALSVAARGKIVAAENANKPIPEGWALDKDGQPTTDATKALQGSLMPLGGMESGAKGAALALMVEILSAALTGSHFGFEASSFFTGEGEPPNIGHTLLAINPAHLSDGHFMARMAILLQAIETTDGARLPGTNRLENRNRAHHHGLTIAASLYADLRTLAV